MDSKYKNNRIFIDKLKRTFPIYILGIIFHVIYYRKNVDVQKEYEHGEFFQRTLLELYNSLIKNDKKEYGYILESGPITS